MFLKNGNFISWTVAVVVIVLLVAVHNKATQILILQTHIKQEIKMTCVTWCYQTKNGSPAEIKCTQVAEEPFEKFMERVAEKQEEFPPITKK